MTVFATTSTAAAWTAAATTTTATGIATASHPKVIIESIL